MKPICAMYSGFNIVSISDGIMPLGSTSKSRDSFCSIVLIAILIAFNLTYSGIGSPNSSKANDEKNEK